MASSWTSSLFRPATTAASMAVSARRTFSSAITGAANNEVASAMARCVPRISPFPSMKMATSTSSSSSSSLFHASSPRFLVLPREVVFSLVKGLQGMQNHCYGNAAPRAMKHLQFAYWSRMLRHRQFRTLWISRINPAAREYGVSFSRLILGMRRANIHLDRKMLATLIESEPVSFKAVVDETKRLLYYPRGRVRKTSQF
ncbi:unnamed protein product [Amoebophrya sp. A25]|nr:unnamed protein product [Amoebophrya sp. A25]|eukprot:GSA25T00004882001.1